MTTAPSFQRARTPDEKAHRQRAILEAAAALFDSEGLNGVSLNAVARRAGIAKSNLYRYFESREAMFLALLVEDETAWVASLEESLSRLPHKSDVKAVARALAQNIVAAPRLCALTAALSSVLERNVSDQSALAFKRSVLRVGLRIGNSLRAALPAFPAEGVGPLLRYLHVIVAGLYPVAHPSPAVARALEHPELASFRSDFRKDLENLLVAVLASLCERS
jgi:AcrR family transcriptional regulator